MAVLRAGLIGLGMMGRHHARLLRSVEGVELVAVADQGGDPHGVAGSLPVMSGVADLISSNLDIAVVAVPTVYHEAVCLALAEAGVHVMVEKPLASDVASAARIADAFARAGLVGCVGHIERFNPALQQLRQRLAAGELGRVFQVVARRQGPFPSRIADVGVVKDLATHDIDSVSWVTGQPFSSVSARVGYMSGRKHEDLVVASASLADGTVVSLNVNWLSPFKERTLVVVGERGAFVASTLTSDLEFFANGTVATEPDSMISHFRGVTEGESRRFAFSKPEPLRTEHEAFRDAVRGEDAEIVTLTQGTAIVAVAEACLESSRNGGAAVTL